MKTKKNALYRIFFLLAMTLAFTSCEYVGLGIEFGNGSYDYRERTDYLCSRVWVDEWYDDYDVYHYQELRFYPDNTGEDYLYTQDRGGTHLIRASALLTATDIRIWITSKWEETS